ncbi:voltage-gated potassium channel [Fomitiporia mediterranea MF3/22]|uniref:voltage-gated potassium channel n=1 Tax=Fomitiporia mediterranea (strain MF3/22) TaxID=694068 RepID=UPI000440973D|nr:voltage-gated potassium channel [Fomitiporia mediterranea MF3/22]EJD04663.1 voltage-gated potassium channel [Fomitiporia mediterranea MF3/22]
MFPSPSSRPLSHRNGGIGEQYELQSFGLPYDGTAAFNAPELSSIHPPWKRSLHELLEHPSASPGSFLVHVVSTSLIVFSALVTVCETIPTFRATSPSVWFGIESSLVVLFTVEYIARALAWSVSWSIFWRWALSFFGIVDFLAIAPYYVELFLGVDTSVMFRFSILRTFRLLRVFRAFRTNNTITLTIEVMYLSVRHSQHALLALGFFLLMFLVIFSTILYFIERGTWDPILQTFIDADGEPSQFSSIPAAGWFVLVTIATVGYGDLTPRSFLGRLLTVPLLVFGLLLIALPSFVLGREFSALWDAHARENARMNGHGPDLASVDLDDPSIAALARQIVDLQGALDTQGQMLRRLLSATEALSTFRKSTKRGTILFDALEDENEDVISSAEKEVDLGGERRRNVQEQRAGWPDLASPNSRRRFFSESREIDKGKGRASSPGYASGSDREKS